MAANPRFYKGSVPAKERVTAAASKTWQAGQFARSTDSGWVPVLSNGSQINGIFAETQATATASGAKVFVHRISSASQLFTMTVTEGSTDTKAKSSYIGGNYGVAVNSCVATISVGNDSTEILHVYDLLANKEGYRNATSDVPGQLVVGVVASALTADRS